MVYSRRVRNSNRKQKNSASYIATQLMSVSPVKEILEIRRSTNVYISLEEIKLLGSGNYRPVMISILDRLGYDVGVVKILTDNDLLRCIKRIIFEYNAKIKLTSNINAIQKLKGKKSKQEKDDLKVNNSIPYKQRSKNTASEKTKKSSKQIKLISKRGTKVKGIFNCSSCRIRSENLIKYSHSNRGEVLLCAKCKIKVRQLSFGKSYFDAMALRAPGSFGSNSR